MLIELLRTLDPAYRVEIYNEEDSEYTIVKVTKNHQYSSVNVIDLNGHANPIDALGDLIRVLINEINYLYDLK